MGDAINTSFTKNGSEHKSNDMGKLRGGHKLWNIWEEESIVITDWWDPEHTMFQVLQQPLCKKGRPDRTILILQLKHGV